MSDVQKRTFDPARPEHDPFLRDFVLFTDGSGHKDGLGGCCCVAANKDLSILEVLAHAQTHTSTARMEFQALLSGLQFVCETLPPTLRRPNNKEPRPTVFWLSDRQDLVLSVAGLQGRNKNQDMWAAFSVYDQVLDIHPYYSKRNTYKLQATADEVAGECRNLIKGYKEVRKSK